MPGTVTSIGLQSSYRYFVYFDRTQYVQKYYGLIFFPMEQRNWLHRDKMVKMCYNSPLPHHNDNDDKAITKNSGTR